MKLNRVEINMKFPTLNEYIDANRTHRQHGAKMKRDLETGISYFVKRMRKINRPVEIHFRWIETSRRRDPDNIAFAKKFILDTMVKCGKLPDDGWEWVRGFSDSFEIGKTNKVIVYIREV